MDEDYLHDFGLYGGEVRQRVINAEFAFYERSMRAGLRMIWAELERVESHHILSQAYMIAYHLRVLSCYGPVERSIRFARIWRTDTAMILWTVRFCHRASDRA